MRYLIFLIWPLLGFGGVEMPILYLHQIEQRPPVLSNVFEPPQDLGDPGAKLAIRDSDRSARFLQQHYTLDDAVSQNPRELWKAYAAYVAGGGGYVVANVGPMLFRALLRDKAVTTGQVMLINVALTDTHLRRDFCLPNLLHTIASDAMLYDALMQHLVARRISKILLLQGKYRADARIAEAITTSAKKFGLKIVDTRTWEGDGDVRRKAQGEMPRFTQARDYDVILTADYYGDFGEYVYFNTWLPRPVAGTQGLMPVIWHRAIEQWGAAQMQNRFETFSGRPMHSVDFAAWLAIRTIANAAMHTGRSDVAANLAYIRSPEFELAGYMGRKLSFRPYNGQMRMPIALVHPRGLISTSPQSGFLHPVTDLDTLGLAPSETQCKR